MKAAHKGLKITEEAFGITCEHLVAALTELGVQQKEIDEIVPIALSVKDDTINL